MMFENNRDISAAGRMRDFISANLHRKITSRMVAEAAGYSQYHAARLFKKETGLSPFEYIRRERLVKSARTLRSGNAKVLDTALDFVFDSHEGFTRAFSNAFGITPKKYADYPAPDGWMIPYHFLDRQKIKSEGTVMEKSPFIFTQIVERPRRKLILRRSKNASHYFEYMDEVGCTAPGKPEPWDILCDIKEAIYEPVGVWLPENMRTDIKGIYAHGVEVAFDYAGEIPNGFDVIDLEPCKFFVFQGEPYDDEYYQDAVGACMDRIEQFNPEVYGYRYDEKIAPKMQLAPTGWRGYIEMRPVAEIREG